MTAARIAIDFAQATGDVADHDVIRDIALETLDQMTMIGWKRLTLCDIDRIKDVGYPVAGEPGWGDMG